MLRHNFEQQLRKLQDEVLVLGSMVEGAVIDAVDTLQTRDLEGAKRIVAYDERVNRKRFEIEDATLTLIATQQPTASDMRHLAAVLEIITELERIGDYAKGIASINLRMSEIPFAKPLVDIPAMASKGTDMLHRALDAFVNRDIEAAKTIAQEDDEVDAFYNRVYREVIDLISKKPDTFDQATYLLWISHNLERTGDRVVNICERILFMSTGEMVEIRNSYVEPERIVATQ